MATTLTVEISLIVSKTLQGRLVLRYRKAAEEDVLFMERLLSAQKAKISGVYGDETFVQPHVSSGKFLHREHRKGMIDWSMYSLVLCYCFNLYLNTVVFSSLVGTETQHRVKPGPGTSKEPLVRFTNFSHLMFLVLRLPFRSR